MAPLCRPKPFFRVVFIAALLLSLTGRSARCEQLSGTVVAVESGDTFTVETDGRTERIRLEGIDCPEMGQPFGDAAKSFTAQRILNRRIRAEIHSRDSYNGTWSVVFTPDGKDLGRELLQAGLAWWYHRYSEDKSLGELETKARLARRGLWSQIAPMAPWDFRRGVWK